MGFPKEIIAKAMEMKAEQREIAINRAETAKEKLYRENTTLAELDRALSAAGAQAAIVALSGDKKLMIEFASKTSELNEKRKSLLAAHPLFPAKSAAIQAE